MTISADKPRERQTLKQLPVVARFTAETGPATTVLSEGKGKGRGGSQSGALFESLRNLLTIDMSDPLPDVFKFVSTRGRMLREDHFRNFGYEDAFNEVEAELGKEAWYTRLGVQQIAATALNEGQYRVSVFLDKEGQSKADSVFELLDELPLSIDTRTPKDNQRHHFVLDLPTALIKPKVLEQGINHQAVKDLMAQKRGQSAIALGVGLSVARGYDYQPRRKS
jgi:hypothetical protein